MSISSGLYSGRTEFWFESDRTGVNVDHMWELQAMARAAIRAGCGRMAHAGSHAGDPRFDLVVKHTNGLSNLNNTSEATSKTKEGLVRTFLNNKRKDDDVVAIWNVTKRWTTQLRKIAKDSTRPWATIGACINRDLSNHQHWTRKGTQRRPSRRRTDALAVGSLHAACAHTSITFNLHPIFRFDLKNIQEK